jgi:ketosteroid isomerase-like protein
MTTDEIGRKLVSLCKEGKNLDALGSLYSKDAESVEAMGSEQVPARMKGVDAIKKKNEWWFANHQIHGGTARGPFPNGDRFAVIFTFDVTPKAGPMAGKRMQMEEVAVYTVEGGKIAREEFFYAMG